MLSMTPERKFIFLFLGYMQVEHDDASSTSIKTISAIIPKCPTFQQPFCVPKSDVFHLFGVFFDTQLLHNNFYSSLKSPL